MSSQTSTSKAAGGFNYGSYITGFGLSLALTLSAYWLVRWHVQSHHLLLSHKFAVAAIAVLAVTQLLVQLIYFLHLGKEARPFWNLQVLIFALGTVFIIVFGSLWIMSHLKYHMSSSQQINSQIIRDEGLQQ